MSGPLRITELDFDTIKTNLQNFLKAQTEFADYNFDGAGLSVLLDILSYNTHYNAMLVHLQANEQFIDTAIKRASVVSIAKTLGYVPRSTICSRVNLKLIVTPSEMSPAPTLTIDPSVNFTTTINNVAYTFNVETTQTVALKNGKYTFDNVSILEGTRLTNAFSITSDLVNGPLTLPVNNIDVNTLLVAVRTSINDYTTKMFTRITSIVDILPTSNVFWVEEGTDGNYDIVFGDNNIGQALTVGNIVSISYIASNGSAPNGANIFSLNGTVGGESNVAIQLLNAAGAGAEKETIDEIRFNAPKFNATRNRVVTAQDYKSLILDNLSSAKSVVVWGGEDNVPPVYGKVFITVDPKDGYVITDNDKNFILNTVLKPRNVMAIQAEFVDPEFLYIGFNVVVSFDPNTTNYTATDIVALVQNQISSYFATNLSTLDKTFFFSQFADSLTAINSSIVGVLIDMKLQQRITQIRSFNTTNNLQFLASLEPGSIHSSIFVSMVNGLSFNVYLQDFPNDSIPNPTGSGTIKLLDSVTNNILVNNIGTVDYGKGVMSFSALNITAYLGNITDVRINATPQSLSKNISSRIITTTPVQSGVVLPTPSVNIIIKLDDSAIDSDINLQAGVTVSAVAYIQST